MQGFEGYGLFYVMPFCFRVRATMDSCRVPKNLNGKVVKASADTYCHLEADGFARPDSLSRVCNLSTGLFGCQIRRGTSVHLQLAIQTVGEAYRLKAVQDAPHAL